MDIYEYLKMDHKKVDDLFNQFNKTSLFTRKVEIVAMIAQELSVHAKAEEQTFYKALEAHPESQGVVHHGEKEHKEIEDKIKSVLNAKDTAAWQQEVLELEKIVNHHIKEEEGPLFSKARKVLSTDDAFKVKEKMHHLKGILLTDYQAKHKAKSSDLVTGIFLNEVYMIGLEKLIKYPKSQKLILATAESCTGGEVMGALAKQGNCGECLFIGYVVYNEIAKQKELGVKKSTIKKYSLTSEEVAREMVIGVFQHQEINVALATTGITGTESMDGIPPGTVCFAWGFKGKNKKITVFSETKLFKGPSKMLPRKAALYALSRIEEYHQEFLGPRVKKRS